MDASRSYIYMPVVRIDSDLNDDHQSKKEKQRQIDRQLPRMRIAEKNRSEKILANAMQTGVTKKSVQEFSALPRPADIKNKNYSDHLNHDLRGKESLDYRSDSKESLDHRSDSKESLDHFSDGKENVNHPEKKNDLSHHKDISSLEVSELHAMEERLHHRKNPPSLSDMLTLLKNTDKKIKNDQKSEIKAKQDVADQEDLLCSLDFLGGYVSASSEMPVIRAEIMEVIESLRQQVTYRNSDPATNISLQQEGLVQLLSDSETQCSVVQDASGHQKLVIEVSESTMNKIVSSPRRAETKDAASNRVSKPIDDSLPLAVQRSV